MKKTNHNTHHSENSPANSYGTMDTDDEAAGRLRSTDLHCIIVAALEGHEKATNSLSCFEEKIHLSDVCFLYDKSSQ